MSQDSPELSCDERCGLSEIPVEVRTAKAGSISDARTEASNTLGWFDRIDLISEPPESVGIACSSNNIPEYTTFVWQCIQRQKQDKCPKTQMLVIASPLL